MSDLQITALFPTFLFFKDHPDPATLNAQLLEACNRLRERDPKGVGISNRGGWQSDDDINERSEFALFVSFVEDTMAEVKEFLTVEDQVTFRVATAWVNFNARRDYNVKHVHGNSFFSGVYYVKVPENAGHIKIFDPNPVRMCFHPPYKEVGPHNCFSQEFDPAEGRLVIFPGYVPHEVTPTMNDEERCSIAFNVVIG
ncbi:MAG: hypothetical protein GWP69_11100 [Gammaproteobacteria bacterium]|nr:hypothetical protein [Gammaproteobacteria bacterium]